MSFVDSKIINIIIYCLQTLSHCELITDDGIRQLAAGSCAAESLSVLELDNCPLITDQTLEHLVSCHNLQRIELYDCQMITRAAIRRLRVSKICYTVAQQNSSSDFIYVFFFIQKNHLPNIRVHAYFAPVTPPPTTSGARPRYRTNLLYIHFVYSVSEISLIIYILPFIQVLSLL